MRANRGSFVAFALARSRSAPGPGFQLSLYPMSCGFRSMSRRFLS
jgi:hypothetical protein